MPRREERTLDWATYGYSFAARLKWFRKQRKLSQEGLSQLSGVHRNTISNMERNVGREKHLPADPHLSMIYELARALDVPPEALLPDPGRTPATRSREHRSDMAFAEVEVDLRSSLHRTRSWEPGRDF